MKYDVFKAKISAYILDKSEKNNPIYLVNRILWSLLDKAKPIAIIIQPTNMVVAMVGNQRGLSKGNVLNSNVYKPK